MKRLLLACILILSFSYGFAQEQKDIFGKWMTIDDGTNKPKSIVEIYEKDGKAFGRITQLFREPDEDPDPLCDECEGSKFNKRIIGMEILTDMKKSGDGDNWEDGEILDPENGNVYRCKIWIDNGDLKVRGYVMFLYRTQTWKRES